MKRLLTLVALFALVATSTAAQQSRTTSKMLYHDGPVLKGTQNLYLIRYGCWNDNCGLAGDFKTPQLMGDFIATLGNTPYIQINSTYADSTGQAPSGALIYGGDVADPFYSHGLDLTPADMTGIISDLVNSFQLPQDPRGIYVILASADVASTATGFCTTSALSYHAEGIVNGVPVRYVFLGNPNRCPSAVGPQFSRTGPTPNGSYTGDVLVNNLAHGLNSILTNPAGNGWFDRYGLENADKCQNNFGQTYTTSNGARANVKIGGRDYLIQQNWVNDRKPHCGMTR